MYRQYLALLPSTGTFYFPIRYIISFLINKYKYNLLLPIISLSVSKLHMNVTLRITVHCCALLRITAHYCALLRIATNCWVWSNGCIYSVYLYIIPQLQLLLRSYLNRSLFAPSLSLPMRHTRTHRLCRPGLFAPLTIALANRSW